jgi:hypothetical protein
MHFLRIAEAQAGALAQLACLVVDLQIAEMVEQTGGMQGRLPATGFFMNQDQTQGGGPQIAVRHGIPPQAAALAIISQSRSAAMAVLINRLFMMSPP